MLNLTMYMNMRTRARVNMCEALDTVALHHTLPGAPPIR